MRTLEPAPAARSAGQRALLGALRAFGGRARWVRGARARVWAPIALRALALGIAMLGLMGIGSVVMRASTSPGAPRPPLGVSHAELGLAALSARALAAFGSAGPPPLAAEPASGANAAASHTRASASPAPLAAPGDSGRPEMPAAAPDGGAANAPCPERAGEAAQGSPAAHGAPVVLNRADAAELQRLPGVGAKRAEAILALRQRLGRFRRPSDLLRVKGIGPRTLERMLPHLVLD